MTHFKKLLCLLLSMLLVCSLAFTGCSSDTATDKNQENQNTVSEKEEQTVTYPVTFKDHLNRSITIEKEPETLVSGYYISTSLLIALGQECKLVGIEAKAKTRPIYAFSAPELLNLPSVGTAKEFDLEGCAALNPDLVIVPTKLKDTIPSLEALGLQVIAVNPENQELLEETITMLGTAVNQLGKANELLDFTKDALTNCQMAVSTEEAPTVYLAGNSSFLSTAGSNMYQHTLITNAGGKNVAEALTDSYWSQISYEQLISWNPEYIILAADADYTIQSVLEDPALAELDAVKNKQVYQFPSGIESWDSPVPGSVLGTLFLASTLHGDAYEESQYLNSASTFYTNFYGFTPTAEDLK